MKANAKDTDSSFEKCFAKFPFNSGKNLWWRIDSTKAFLFRYIHIFSKKLMRFRYFVSPGTSILYDMFFKEQQAILQFCFRPKFIWIIFCTYNSKRSLTVSFARKLRKKWAKRWTIFETKLKKRIDLSQNKLLIDFCSTLRIWWIYFCTITFTFIPNVYKYTLKVLQQKRQIAKEQVKQCEAQTWNK